jgi:O-antigen/teichoic acid export membrane protein
MLQFISKEEYGLYILCVDFLAWMGFLDLGINKVIETKAAHLMVKEDFEGLNKTLNSALSVQILVSIIIIPLYFLLVYFGIGTIRIEQFELVIAFFALSAAVTNIKNLFSSTIVASRKIHLDNRIQVYINLLQYILILVLVPFTNLFGLAAINLVIVILILLRSGWRIQKLFPDIRWNLRNFDVTTIRGIFKDGLFFSLSSLATLFLMKIDSFVIGKEFNLEMVAAYYVSIKLFMLTLKIGEMIINNFRPHVSRMYVTGDYESIRLFYEKMMVTIFCIGSIALFVVSNINEYFLEIWVGKSFFLNTNFNVFFGYFILFSLLTLPARIIIVSSLYKIHQLSILRFSEGAFRILIILLFIHLKQIEILPITSVLALYIFGIIAFHILLRGYFKKHGLENFKGFVIQITALMIFPFLVYFFKLSELWSLLLIPVMGTIFWRHFKRYKAEFLTLANVLLKK